MTSQKNDVGAFFSRFSKDWDTLYGEKRNIVMRVFDYIFRRDIYQRYEMTFKALEGNISGSSILDIGCGNGIYAIDAIKKGASQVTGIDVAEQMIELCNQMAEKEAINDKTSFTVSNYPVSSSLRQELGNMDYAIVMGVMDYVYDPIPFLTQLKEMTNKEAYITFPGGKFIRYNLRKYRYKMLGRVHVLGYTSESEIESLLKESGFSDISIDYLSHSGGCYFVKAK